VAGLQFGLGFAKTIFWGKGFGKNSADLPPAERGLGNECGRARTGGQELYKTGGIWYILARYGTKSRFSE